MDKLKLDETDIIIKLDQFLINDLTDIVIFYCSFTLNQSEIKNYLNLDTCKKDKDFFHIGKILCEIKCLHIANMKNYITILIGQSINNKHFILCYSEENVDLRNSDSYKIIKYKKYDKFRKLLLEN